MEEAKKITATLKVVATGEFIDSEASEDTVRYFVEQYLEDSGFDVEVELPKEQEAKTIEFTLIDRSLGAELVGYCPSCDKLLKERFNKFFCGNCGQAVKWDES